MAKKWSALTPLNLAILGALDDFLGAYNQCLDTFEDSIYQKEKCIKQCRKICEPLLQQYTTLFTDLVDRKIHANAYAFANFSMSYFEIDRNQMLTVILKRISFSSFLERLHVTVIRCISRWKNQLQPSYMFGWAEETTNRRILDLVAKQKQHMKIRKSEVIVPTKSPLYLIGNLYGTKCYRDRMPHIKPIRTTSLCRYF